MLDLLKELTRRKVWLFGGIYLALGWVLLQVAVVLETTLTLPDWVDQIALVLLGLGFPIALLLAWAQESQRDGRGSKVSGTQSEGPVETRPSFSVAVLPFDDLSPDGAFGEVADGIAEDTLTHLSYFGILKVTARNSSFAYKGTSPDIRELGTQLNVRFVLEGSFRSLGQNVRITSQLIDALSGEHVWSRNFDREADAIHTELDGLVDVLSGDVSSMIMDLETLRLAARPIDALSPDDLAALSSLSLSGPSKDVYLQAEKYMRISLDKRPNHGRSLALMAQVQIGKAIFGGSDAKKHRRLAEDYLAKARAAGQPDFDTLISLAVVAYMMGKQADVEILSAQMREVGHKHPAAWTITSMSHQMSGRYKDALDATKRSLSLTSTRNPFYSLIRTREATAQFCLGNYLEAEACARVVLATTERIDTRVVLVAALVRQDKLNDARAEAEPLRATGSEGLSLDRAKETLKRLFFNDEIVERTFDDLQRAGLV
jgi:adenylate cyclase